MVPLTNMSPQSLDAYFGEVKPTLGARQKEIYDIFFDNPTMDFTNNELLAERRVKDPFVEINQITPRVYELRGKGKNNPLKEKPILVFSRVRECAETHRMVNAWQLNPDW